MPYDVDELLDVISPRPALLYTPQNDADATYLDVATVVAKARESNKNLENIAPASGSNSTSEFGREQIDVLLRWLDKVTAQ